jgi:multiple sugar transport system permease protein
MTARAFDAGSVADARAAIPSPWRRAWTANGPGYMFLLPWFIGFFGLTVGPILISLYLSFTNFDLLTAPQWTGFDNYARMFTADPKFIASMRVTFLFVVFSVPLKLAFALCVALVLNRGM